MRRELLHFWEIETEKCVDMCYVDEWVIKISTNLSSKGVDHVTRINYCQQKFIVLTADYCNYNITGLKISK